VRPFPTLRAVVTGANRADGIGLALVRELAGHGAPQVIGTYRDAGRALPLADAAAADPRVRAGELDVMSDESVTRFGEWCRRELGRVDLLVNNAGLGDAAGDVLTAPVAELEQQLQTHALGMLRATRALLPLMERGAVVLNVSSTLGSIAQMDGGWAFYSVAKALQNALTRELAATVRRKGIVVCAVSPGWVATSMGGRGAFLTPAQSAADLVRIAEAVTLTDSGTFREHDGRPLPW